MKIVFQNKNVRQMQNDVLHCKHPSGILRCCLLLAATLLHQPVIHAYSIRTDGPTDRILSQHIYSIEAADKNISCTKTLYKQ